MPAIDRDHFFNVVRSKIFFGYLTQSQVDGMNAILDAAEQRGVSDVRWLAYEFATACWETNRQMQPVIEAYWMSEQWRRVNLRYYPYYGRGYVQTTWEDNYRKVGEHVGVDLVKNPEAILEPHIAAEALFWGMENGIYTGVALGRYFNDTKEDPVNARRIINGTDRAQPIAALYYIFKEALTAPIKEAH